MTGERRIDRHFGMDWLRIGAFGLLILYHVGMFFVHWDWHVKTADPLEWAAIPMLALSPWRLSLLFVVSGYATRAVLLRAKSLREFTGGRTKRLLIPLVFAMVFLIAPQPWVELMWKHGYAGNYLHFWTRDYFRFGAIDGILLPTWQHLWFVLYLWGYTVIAAILAPLAPRLRAQAVFDRIFGHAGALLVPLAWFLVMRGFVVQGEDETHAFVDDWPGHIVYFPAFLFGLGLACSGTAWAGIRRWWKAAAAMAVLCYLPIAATEIVYPGTTPFPPSLHLPYFSVRALQGAAAVIALIGLADRFWNRDGPGRKTLTEAVFPFYIIHQTIIVLVGWYLLRLRLPPSGEFVILVAATALGCWLFFEAARRFRLLRPMVGLKATAKG
ncbi:MAG TPA: acyltransferase family protein [Allosphingosinicella sp.]|jgi:hypothetical protein